MYYLNSRYYNPNWGRFINADHADVIAATPMDLTDKNLFAYCDNNPITRVDDGGEFWIQLGIGAAVGLVSGIIDFVQSEEDFTWISAAQIVLSTVSGAAAAVVNPVAGAIISGSASAINSTLSGNDTEEVVADAIASTAISLVGGATQLAVGRVKAGAFIKSASKNKLKMFARDLGYTGKYFKAPACWTGEIMFDASAAFMDKPLPQIVGYSTTFAGERLWNSYSLR